MTIKSAKGIIAYPPKSWNIASVFSPENFVKAIAVTVNLTVLQNNATGKPENNIISFSHHFLCTNKTTQPMITKNDVIILNPLQASETAIVAPLNTDFREGFNRHNWTKILLAVVIFCDRPSCQGLNW